MLFSSASLWVWCLLFFLIRRGVSALKPRKIPVSRIFIVPVVFLVISVWHLNDFIFYPSLLSYVFSWILLCAIRVAFLWNQTVVYDADTGLIERSGSPLVLILVMASFGFKFAMYFLLARNPMLSQDYYFSCLWGIGSGIITGLSWGGLLYTLYTLNNSNCRKAATPRTPRN